ncbi:MAG: RNA polymerase factor sigma-54 [Deltaproteobacteria bacterium]|nr:RNA polymerase factor sigma-54 [Deltaproteobacteria bacterium]MBW2482762.1 RNA polymerase factor sigma-54 [Deltaproteobacteria bacterium]
MALELRQQLKLTQQLIMTPQLQMAIKLLQLSRLELMDTIRAELEENPALEEVPEGTPNDQLTDGADNTSADATETKEVTIEEKLQEDIDWSNYLDEYNTPGRVNFEAENRDTPKFESFIAHKESLNDHLLWQFLMTKPQKEEEKIASLIIGNINKDGYLQVSTQEIAYTSGLPHEKVEEVLAIIQSFDPVGVCARDLRECLLIQAKNLGLENTIITDIIDEHLPNLEKKNYKAICKALKKSQDEVVAAVNVIKAMEPKPGRQFSEETPQYINPDIYVYKLDNDFVIMLNDDGMPKLRVNSFYRNSIGRGKKVSGEAEDYIQEKMRSAAWLIKSIHQRQKTIYRVMESILRYQREFFDKGIAYLKPMVLRDVAQDIGMHESTISRVTTNKYAFTPQGIFELKYFFNSSIRRMHGGAIASASVQEKIRQIIQGEDPRKPYSDDKIAQILKNEEIHIARRTVAKYREMLKVLPSNKRKEL